MFFSLYYEAYFTPYTVLATQERSQTQGFDLHLGFTVDQEFDLWQLSIESRTEHFEIQKVSFCQKTGWELEDMEYVRYHICYPHKALKDWRRICPLSQQNVLPEFLIVHIPWCRGPDLYTKHSLKSLAGLPMSDKGACGWIRLYLQLGLVG